MWRIGDVKQRAWNILSKNYWSALLAVFIFTILAGVASSVVSLLTSTVFPGITSSGLALFDFFSSKNEMALIGQITVYMIFFIFITIFSFALAISVIVFVTYPLQYGLTEWFVTQRKHETYSNFETLFSAFRKGTYKRVASGMGWSFLWQSLWTLCASVLFIIPTVTTIFGTGAVAFVSKHQTVDAFGVFVILIIGSALYIIAAALYMWIILNRYYAYMFIPYLLVEEKGLSYREVMDKSKRMTDGQKGKMFLLDLSFIGWVCLVMLSCGLLSIALMPYMQTARAEMYFARKEEYEKEIGRRERDAAPEKTDEPVQQATVITEQTALLPEIIDNVQDNESKPASQSEVTDGESQNAEQDV